MKNNYTQQELYDTLKKICDNIVYGKNKFKIKTPFLHFSCIELTPIIASNEVYQCTARVRISLISNDDDHHDENNRILSELVNTFGTSYILATDDISSLDTTNYLMYIEIFTTLEGWT